MKIPRRVVFGFNLMIFLPQLHRWRCRETEVHQADSLSLPWKWHRSGDHRSAVRSAGRIDNNLLAQPSSDPIAKTFIFSNCLGSFLQQSMSSQNTGQNGAPSMTSQQSQQQPQQQLQNNQVRNFSELKLTLLFIRLMNIPSVSFSHYNLLPMKSRWIIWLSALKKY